MNKLTEDVARVMIFHLYVIYLTAYISVMHDYATVLRNKRSQYFDCR